jgi:hypothetical protein
MAKKEASDKAVLLNRHNLQVAKFCATEEGSSAALKSVYVEPDGTTACNGHIVVHVSMPKIEPSLFPTLAEAPDMKHDAKPFLLSRDSALEIASNIPKTRTFRPYGMLPLRSTTSACEQRRPIWRLRA